MSERHFFLPNEQAIDDESRRGRLPLHHVPVEAGTGQEEPGKNMRVVFGLLCKQRRQAAFEFGWEQFHRRFTLLRTACVPARISRAGGVWPSVLLPPRRSPP